MISLEVYKTLHVVSIVVFFSFFAIAAHSQQSSKKNMIITGVSLLLVFVAGMGLLARNNVSHGSMWPTWVILKLVIWLIVGGAGHVVVKRFPQHGPKAFWACVVLLGCARYLALVRP